MSEPLNIREAEERARLIAAHAPAGRRLAEDFLALAALYRVYREEREACERIVAEEIALVEKFREAARSLPNNHGWMSFCQGATERLDAVLLRLQERAK